MRLLSLLAALTLVAPAPAADPATHWSLRPRATPAVPLKGLRPIDAFIRDKLQEEGLKPAPPADPRSLLRRVTLDLTGLAPTPADVEDNPDLDAACRRLRVSAASGSLRRTSVRLAQSVIRRWQRAEMIDDTT